MNKVFNAKVRRIGNSSGVIIPAEVMTELGIHDGDVIPVALPVGKQNNRDRLLDLAGLFKGAEPFKRDKEDRY